MSQPQRQTPLPSDPPISSDETMLDPDTAAATRPPPSSTPSSAANQSQQQQASSNAPSAGLAGISHSTVTNASSSMSQAAPNPDEDGDAEMGEADDGAEDDGEVADSIINGSVTEPNTQATASSTSAPAGTTSSLGILANDEEEHNAMLEAAEARIAQKKDVTLREFLGKMDDYAPIIPDALTIHYLTLAGLPPPPATPLPLARLLALATQKFIADIAADAYQYARIRSGHSTSGAANAGLAAVAAGVTGAGSQGMNNQGGGGPGMSGGLGGMGGGGPGGAGATSATGKGLTLGAQRPGFGGGGAGGPAANSGPGGLASGGAGAAGQGRTVLTMEDLGMAVGEYGVNIKRGEFYR